MGWGRGKRRRRRKRRRRGKRRRSRRRRRGTRRRRRRKRTRKRRRRGNKTPPRRIRHEMAHSASRLPAFKMARETERGFRTTQEDRRQVVQVGTTIKQKIPGKRVGGLTFFWVEVGGG